MNPSRRHVAVHVGVERPRQVAEVRSKVALFGILPPSAPSLVDAWPSWRVKSMVSPRGDKLVEHLRVPAGADLSVLPGLATQWPSHLRDAARLAFAGGAKTIDLVVARAPSLEPTSLSHPDALELLQPLVADVAGLVVVFPDAAGEPTVGLRGLPPEARLANLVETVRVWSPELRDAWCVGLADLPDAPPQMTFKALEHLSGSDFALCAWTGAATELRQHGWRCGAAVLGGRLASLALPSDSLVGVTCELPGGRPRTGERLIELGIERPGRFVPEFAEYAVVELRLERGGRAVIGGESVLRAPAGAWSLPMLRTVKLVHQRVVVTSNLFVFRHATAEQAMLLQNALRMALDAFERKELLGGPLPGEPSRIVVEAVSDPAQPSLVASVTTFLRPWLRELRLDVLVRPGEQPRVEVG